METSVMALKPGDRVRVRAYPSTTGYELEEGIVTYIHPELRFITLEYTNALGQKFRQSFIPHGPAKVKD